MTTASTSPAADAALAVSGVSKVFGRFRKKVYALRGVDMTVARGSVFGLLGPNGAGKSTLVKVLLTIITPKSCSGTMLGAPVGHKPTLGRIGYLPEHHRFPPYLKGKQALDHFAALSGVARTDRRQRVGETLELVGMSEWADHKVGGYSKGMRQRLGIAQALMNDPELVILDEPTDGVDPVGRRDIRKVVERIASEGKTVFLNSHLLGELELVCDRVAIMVKGRVAAQGTLDELTAPDRAYEIRLADDEMPPEQVKTMLPQDAKIEGSVIRLASDDPTLAQPVLRELLSNGRTIQSARPVRPSLEDLFMRVVGDDSGPGGSRSEGAGK
ncbi:MAG: ABC transporter ATP-binding protein [Planctomycetota bacterium]